MSKKVLVATYKPFARDAITGMKEIFGKVGYELELLEGYTDHNELVEAVKDVNALIVRSDKINEKVLNAAKELEIIVRGGAGYDNIDLKLASEKDIVVMNTPGQNSNAVAELAFGMMVYLARGKFNGKPGTELKGKTLGIHAYGNVGKNIARLAKGFEMDVLAFDPFVDDDLMKQDDVKPVKSEIDLYSQCNYVSLHLPKVKQTINFINYELLSKMKENAVLVNTARKEVVDEKSLKKIFADRDDFKYISDIAPDCREELEEEYPDRCFFTPKKMGAQTKEANVNAGLAAANQIVGYFKEGKTTFQVNK